MEREKPKVKLINEDGNAFSIMGKVTKVLKKSGFKSEYIDQYKKEAMSGDYNNLLLVTMEYVDIV